MTPEAPSSAALTLIEQVARVYAALTQSALAGRETSLGGRFFYAGELDEHGRAAVVAANIAGATTLAATGDREAQKQALRDGVADFLVNSLDEALRILKNQLRKRESVAVSVALSPQTAETEMNERGVVPDLLRPDALHEAIVERLSDGGTSEETVIADAAKAPAVVTWSVDSSPAWWLPRLDAIALDALDAGDWAARRWVRLAPRYLGRMAQSLRLLRCAPADAAMFIERVSLETASGAIGAAVEIRLHNPNGQVELCRFAPDRPRNAS